MTIVGGVDIHRKQLTFNYLLSFATTRETPALCWRPSGGAVSQVTAYETQWRWTWASCPNEDGCMNPGSAFPRASGRRRPCVTVRNIPAAASCPDVTAASWWRSHPPSAPCR
jgi:hypothetical protein